MRTSGMTVTGLCRRTPVLAGYRHVTTDRCSLSGIGTGLAAGSRMTIGGMATTIAITVVVPAGAESEARVAKTNSKDNCVTRAE